MARMTTAELCKVVREIGLVGVGEADYVEEQRRALVELLRRGGHMVGCDIRVINGGSCSCGWSEIERAAKSAGVIE